MSETVNTGSILTSDGNGGYSKFFTDTMTDLVKLSDGSTLTKKLEEIDGKLPITLTSGSLPNTLQTGRVAVEGSNFYCGNGDCSPCQLALASQIPSAYVHPSTKQCNYSYTHPTAKQCSWTPDMDGYMKKSDLGVETYALSALPVGAVVNFGRHQVNNEIAWRIPWRIVAKNHSGFPSNSVTLMANNIIDLRAFDAAEPNNSNSDRKSYGNNNWRYSNLRLWLNSSAGAGSWYSAQHSADHTPDNSYTNYNTGYSGRPGFLYNFSEAERNILMSTTTRTINNTVVDGGGSYTTSDKIFLPSETEVGIGNEGSVAEGVIFEYFKNSNSRVAIVQEEAYIASLSSSKPSSLTSAWYYWLRTPGVGHSYIVRFVGTDGSLSYSYAYYGYIGVRPCLNLPASTVVTKFRDWYDINAG